MGRREGEEEREGERSGRERENNIKGRSTKKIPSASYVIFVQYRM